MLWADDNSYLPNNYYPALAQFKTFEKRLDKDCGFNTKYTETLQEDIDEGYVISVKSHDQQLRSTREWYLPHRPVLNPNKPRFPKFSRPIFEQIFALWA